VRGRIFSGARPSPDARPALFSVVALMVLLVPLVLVTSTGQKTTGMALGLPGPGAELPPDPLGPVEGLRVQQQVDGFLIQARVRRTDVLASWGDVELQELRAPDLAILQDHLDHLKRLDPSRQRVTLVPQPDATAQAVVSLMDAVRTGPQGPLFPEIVLETAAQAPSATAPDPAQVQP